MYKIMNVNIFMRNDTEFMQASPRRGRPPSYDRDAALAALTSVFWNQGFAATSLDDLAAATAMNRPSLYGAFGDKQAMYLAALDRYGHDAEVQLGGILAAVPDVRAAIGALLHASVDFYLAGDSGPRGCLAVCTTAAEAVTTPAMRDGLAAVLARLDGVIAARLAQGVADGQLPPDLDVAAAAMLIAGTLHSIAIRARAGSPRPTLLRLAEAGAAALPAQIAIGY
jgi:TetR/AcrR family transcriptional regulator, copper-responsive repressor